MPGIVFSKIISGGQTGVDRVSLKGLNLQITSTG
jgi:hypothetical protein